MGDCLLVSWRSEIAGFLTGFWRDRLPAGFLAVGSCRKRDRQTNTPTLLPRYLSTTLSDFDGHSHVQIVLQFSTSTGPFFTKTRQKKSKFQFLTFGTWEVAGSTLGGLTWASLKTLSNHADVWLHFVLVF